MLLYRVGERLHRWSRAASLLNVERSASAIVLGLSSAHLARAVEPVRRRIAVVPVDVVRSLVEQVGLGEFGVKVGDRLVRVDVGLERRRHGSLSEQVPVDRLEERMLLQFGGVSLCTETVLRVSVQELRRVRWQKSGTSAELIAATKIISIPRKHNQTHPFDELLAVLADDATRELDLAEAAAQRVRMVRT